MVIREAVRNALHHGQASVIRLALRYQPGKLSIGVQDNGRGFSTSKEELAHEKHFGLIGMRERVEKLHGSMTLQSDEGKGAHVTFSFPFGLLSTEFPVTGSGKEMRR